MAATPVRSQALGRGRARVVPPVQLACTTRDRTRARAPEQVKDYSSPFLIHRYSSGAPLQAW